MSLPSNTIFHFLYCRNPDIQSNVPPILYCLSLYNSFHQVQCQMALLMNFNIFILCLLIHFLLCECFALLLILCFYLIILLRDVFVHSRLCLILIYFEISLFAIDILYFLNSFQSWSTDLSLCCSRNWSMKLFGSFLIFPSLPFRNYIFSFVDSYYNLDLYYSQL